MTFAFRNWESWLVYCKEPLYFVVVVRQKQMSVAGVCPWGQWTPPIVAPMGGDCCDIQMLIHSLSNNTLLLSPGPKSAALVARQRIHRANIPDSDGRGKQLEEVWLWPSLADQTSVASWLITQKKRRKVWVLSILAPSTQCWPEVKKMSAFFSSSFYNILQTIKHILVFFCVHVLGLGLRVLLRCLSPFPCVR